ncbi:MAG: ATP-dependent zinc metalloprotease FtsH [Thermoanaerobacteraceae bacterium]|nr:ATP-dependent zinc metalloprotease FtsH [Thermoanaerobacteraceae bacterium]
MNKVLRNASFYILIIIAIYAIVTMYGMQTTEMQSFDYARLIREINSNNVSSITIAGNVVSGELKNGTAFQASIINEESFDAFIQPYIINGQIKYVEPKNTNPPWWLQMLPTIFMIVIFIVFWFLIMQQSQGGGSRVMSFGKSRARMQNDQSKKVTFDDVAGADEEKTELQEVVEFLKQPRRFMELGARIPKGVLLVGPPGTGKTLLAKAVAGEAGVPFFSISGSDFVEMFVGVGAARVRDLFDQAKKNSPCIVFIDEIDAVGRHRGAGLGGGHDEREQTLNQLLVEMDGFTTNEGIIVIAATNRPDILDPALLRPGRFDRQIVVGLPDIKGREQILKVHSRGKPLSPEVDFGTLARMTPGFTGADLENMMNEGALLAARRGKKVIGMDELEEAMTRVIAGPEKKSRVMSEKDKRLVAYHEAGHAVLAKLLPNTAPVHEVSIIPRGRAGGYTMILPEEDKYFMPRSEMVDEVIHLLGGRVAENIVLHDISTGAENDLERATSLVRKMVTEYGMSENLGPMVYGSEKEEVFIGKDFGRQRNYSEEVAASIDKEMRRIIEECYKKAEMLLKENINRLHSVARALIEKEKLSKDEFEQVFASV